MSLRHVIAYAMHEDEIAAASEALSDATATASYVIGDIEEDHIDELESQGLIVEELATPGRVLSDTEVRSGIGATSEGEESMRSRPPSGEPTQWLVTLPGPLLQGTRSAIAETGMQLESYLPQFTYVATGTPEQADACINLGSVATVEHYGPATAGAVRVSAAQRPAEGPSTPPSWDLWLTSEAVRPAVVAWLEGHDIRVTGHGGRRIRVAAAEDPALRTQIVTLNGVLSMVEYIPPKLFNDVARGLLGLPEDSAHVWQAIPGQPHREASGGPEPGQPGAELPMSTPTDSADTLLEVLENWKPKVFPDVRGAGEVVAVADTGLDIEHPDFRGRIVDVVALGRTKNVSDPAGHGTHVAGSIVGDGAASDGQYRGVAPAAKLYFQSILDAQGRLGGLPVSLRDLFEPAYLAGARVHSNSWGAATSSVYTIDANDVDGYVVDRPDMLIVIAAGNEGTSANNFSAQDGYVDWLSLGSTATCKNALTVGAARSTRTSGGYSTHTYGQFRPDRFPRPPIANATVSGDAEGIAAFSSRGPCDDRRIKPDIVAPGTDIISTRSAIAPEPEFWGLLPANPSYAYMGGTSMACPLVAGCALLTREYFVKKREMQPSAALVKATLINGTRWLAGADAVADHATCPNYHQGFGAINMADTLPGEDVDWSLEVVDTWQHPQLSGLIMESGQNLRLEVDVKAGAPLRMCLTYTDLPGRGLQNDLSLVVQDPAGRKVCGNADAPGRITRSDVDNNVEVIRVENPTPGKWLIQVYARNILSGPQEFAFVVSGGLGSDLRRIA